MPDAVFVRGLEFEGNHGYSAAERRGTRRFRVSLTIERDLGAASTSDKIGDTVDYWKVSEAVVRIGGNTVAPTSWLPDRIVLTVPDVFVTSSAPLVITNVDGAEAVSTDFFTYTDAVEPVSIVRVSPSAVPSPAARSAAASGNCSRSRGPC